MAIKTAVLLKYERETAVFQRFGFYRGEAENTEVFSSVFILRSSAPSAVHVLLWLIMKIDTPDDKTDETQ